MPVSAEPRRLGQLLASPIKWAPNYRAEKVLRRLRLARPSFTRKFATQQALWPRLLMRWSGRAQRLIYWACGWRSHAKKLKEYAMRASQRRRKHHHDRDRPRQEYIPLGWIG